MNNFKSIADFKRATVPGTFWDATHRWLTPTPEEPKSLGRRECVHSTATQFGFRNPDTGRTSYCHWPKKAEFSTEDGGNVAVITTTYCQLKYQEVT